jgi:NTE family protein
MKKKIVSLALQGGGSHGAFTWGVLDRLLEERRVDMQGISGASAGAMNAVVLAYGYTVGGRKGARQALKTFWESVASTASFSVLPGEDATAATIDAEAHPTPAFKAFLALARFVSPYQFNPFELDPLRDILEKQIDFERLRTKCPIQLFIATTRVSTGTLRLFRNRHLSIEVLLASACLPSIQRAVEIDGELYWDGGLAANPPIFPLVHRCAARDIVVVILNASRRPEIPKTSDEIWHRLNEISFGSSFFTELQGLALATREAEQSLFPLGRLERRLRQLKMHVIDAQELMSQLSTMSRLNTHPTFLEALRDEGRARADAWLEENFELIGQRSSFRLDSFLR